MIFGPKIGKKIEYKGQKLPIFQKKEKIGTFRVKGKQAGPELKKKKEIFWAKNWGKNEYIVQKLTNFLTKKKAGVELKLKMC